MPLIEEGAKVFTTETRKEIDVVTLARAIDTTKFGMKCAVVEKVDASPNMGVSSAFRFGQGFGILQGVLISHNLQVKYAYPATWKSGMGLSKSKDESLRLACKLFPEWQGTFTKDRRSADLAEAALLAYYGERFFPRKTT